MSNDDPDTVPLRDYLAKCFELVNTKLDSTEKATNLARENLEQRLEGLNEWRQQSKDRERDFLPRSEYHLHHDQVCQDVRELRESRAELAGKASQKSVTLTLILTATALFLSAVGIILGLFHH
jgi:hypothetical protein